MTAPPLDMSGRVALVTGAGGFVGRRLVERLTAAGARVRALVRSYASGAPLSRFDVEMVRGDVLDPASLSVATKGCDVVFHSARGREWLPKERRRVDVDGTRCVLDAALAAGAQRVVHLSTLQVYGVTSDGELDENAPLRRTGDLYADAKAAAERLALAYGEVHPLEVVVLQPTAVYGPRAGVYGTGMLDALRTSSVILVDGGEGLCNCVYVDDLVTAMLLAALSERAAGERFLVSGSEPVTWRAFHERFERMLGVRSTISMSQREALALYRRSVWGRRGVVGEAVHVLRETPNLKERFYDTREGALLMRAAQRLLPPSAFYARERQLAATTERRRACSSAQGSALPLGVLRPFTIRFSATKSRVRIEKARDLLSFDPAFDFDEGMALTEEWARWAGLLEPVPSRDERLS